MKRYINIINHNGENLFCLDHTYFKYKCDINVKSGSDEPLEPYQNRRNSKCYTCDKHISVKKSDYYENIIWSKGINELSLKFCWECYRDDKNNNFYGSNCSDYNYLIYNYMLNIYDNNIYEYLSGAKYF